MNEKQLPVGAGVFLIIVGLVADGTKALLDFLFGIGFILDPCLISPVTWIIFWITLSHNGIPMMSGKRGTSGWINLAIAEVPGVDALPDWTFYAFYLLVSSRVSEATHGIIQ